MKRMLGSTFGFISHTTTLRELKLRNIEIIDGDCWEMAGAEQEQNMEDEQERRVNPCLWAPLSNMPG